MERNFIRELSKVQLFAISLKFSFNLMEIRKSL